MDTSTADFTLTQRSLIDKYYPILYFTPYDWDDTDSEETGNGLHWIN
jgi:hypothetical protein